MDELKAIDERREKLNALLGEMADIQPRSNFVLTHFVVGQHDRPARQRQQAVLELREMLFSLADTADEVRLAELDIEEYINLATTGDDIQRTRYRIRADQARRKIQQLKMHVQGRLHECDFLYGLIQQMPQASRDDLEREEAEYWQARLTRQFALGQRDVGGNLAAMLQMLTEPGQPRPELATDFASAIRVLGLSPEAVSKLLEASND
jgi:small-conductance mechanosensitive channel